MTAQKSPDQNEKENKIVCPEMGYFCFETIYKKLANQKILSDPTFTNDSYPVFVTWKTGDKNTLRGCIGTFTSWPLHEGLRKFSLESAFHDSRFSPITLEELKILNVSVSILHKFEQCTDYSDWEIGTHGIQIKLDTDEGVISATFLPEVAIEQGWTKIETIDALLRKGGFKSEITETLRKKIRMSRYQSDKISVTYQDYLRHCKPKRSKSH